MCPGNGILAEGEQERDRMIWIMKNIMDERWEGGEDRGGRTENDMEGYQSSWEA